MAANVSSKINLFKFLCYPLARWFLFWWINSMMRLNFLCNILYKYLTVKQTGEGSVSLYDLAGLQRCKPSIWWTISKILHFTGVLPNTESLYWCAIQSYYTRKLLYSWVRHADRIFIGGDRIIDFYTISIHEFVGRNLELISSPILIPYDGKCLELERTSSAVFILWPWISTESLIAFDFKRTITVECACCPYLCCIDSISPRLLSIHIVMMSCVRN